MQKVTMKTLGKKEGSLKEQQTKQKSLLTGRRWQLTVTSFPGERDSEFHYNS